MQLRIVSNFAIHLFVNCLPILVSTLLVKLRNLDPFATKEAGKPIAANRRLFIVTRLLKKESDAFQ